MRKPDAIYEGLGNVSVGMTNLVKGDLLYIRTPEDRETLLAAAEILSQLWERALTQERMNYLSELAAKLREMAGDAP